MLAEKNRLSMVLLIVLMLLATGVSAQSITTPTEEFGFNLGDDYQLANYSQLEAYWQKLAEESDRMKLEVIGNTARLQIRVVLSKPNFGGSIYLFGDGAIINGRKLFEIQLDSKANL